MRVDVQSLLRAHAFMRTEAPPEPWVPDVDDERLTRLLGEMIAATLARGAELPELALSVSNVVVNDDEDAMPTGRFVAVGVSGQGTSSPSRSGDRSRRAPLRSSPATSRRRPETRVPSSPTRERSTASEP